MAEEFFIPKLGQTVEEVTLMDWLVEDGSQVNHGDPIIPGPGHGGAFDEAVRRRARDVNAIGTGVADIHIADAETVGAADEDAGGRTAVDRDVPHGESLHGQDLPGLRKP